MLVINNRVFLPQERSRSMSYEEKDNEYTHRRKSIELSVVGIEHYNDILDNCRTLGDAIHEPELFIEKEHSMDFMCVICQCICSTPMDIGCKNGHIYCKQCLNSFFATQSNGQCPQCTDNVSRYGTRINHFALRLLLKLKIFCPFSTEMCHDENEMKQYECEWVGCYSDIIDHLSTKCKFGTFITNTSIERIRVEYATHHTTKPRADTWTDDSIWKVSRAEITSYRVFWEQISDKSKHSGTHIDRRTVQEFYKDKVFNLNNNEIKKLWFIVGDTADQLMSENQFYAALHIARLHNNQYRTQCNLHTLYSLPTCLSPSHINQVRYNSKLSSQDIAKNKAKNGKEDPKKGINLETRIGTMRQLKLIAGIGIKEKKTKHRQNTTSPSISNSISVNWENMRIEKTHVDEYHKWFVKADVNKDGYIDGNEGRNFFTKSKLSAPILGKIWMAIDHERKGKLTESQFYAFFHIVMSLKKTCSTLPDQFVLPSCLEEENILSVMNGQKNRNRTTTKDDVEWINNVFVSRNDLLDSLPAERKHVSADSNHSIDSIHDW
eukprot:33739_1